MRRMFLAVMLLAGTVGLAGCQQIHQVFDPPSSAAPLPQARIQMRDVDEHGSAAATLLKDENGRPLAVLEPAFITTADIASVALDRNTQGGEPLLSLTMTDAAAPRIQAATEARIGRRVAFSVGEKVLSVATIQGPFGKGMQVSGLGDATQAQRMYTEITGKTP
ncbi:SecDF P1 head subdomain-containing protein [Stenotrophomonas rhizophila]